MPRNTSQNETPKILPAQKKLNAFPMQTGKRLYNEAMRSYGNETPHITLAKLNVANTLFPLIYGLTLLPRIIIYKGSSIGRSEQIDTDQEQSLKEALLGINGKSEPTSKLGYKRWIHGQASAKAMCESPLDEYLNHIYLYSATLNLDDVYKSPNPAAQLTQVSKIHNLLDRLVKKEKTVNKGFILFQLSRAQRLLGYYKLEIRSLNESAALHFAVSECLLGLRDMSGYTPETGKTIIKRNTETGKIKLQNAAQSGIDDAAYALGTHYEKKGELKSAKMHFNSAAKNRHPQALQKLNSITNREAKKNRTTPTLPSITEIKESRGLKQNADSLINIMNEYYKMNASETVTKELLRLSKVPELSPLCLYFRQLLNTNFFKDPRPQELAGPDEKETHIGLPAWNQWIVLAGKSSSLSGLGELIKTAHLIVMYYEAIALTKKLGKIEEAQQSLGELVQQYNQGISFTKNTLVSALLEIAGKLDEKQHRLLFTQSIINPDAGNLVKLFNTISDLQGSTKRTLQTQLISLDGIIHSLDHFQNPLYHYIAFCLVIPPKFSCS